MQQAMRYLAALTMLVLVGAMVATIDSVPGKSTFGFHVSEAKDKGNGGGNGNGNGNGGNGNGQGNGHSQGDDAGDDAAEDAKNGDDGKKDKKDKNDKSSKSDDDGDDEDDDRKVMVCHHTGSSSNPGHVIRVSKNAVPAHEGHGDEVVESEEECEAILSGTPVASPEASPDAGTPVASPVAGTPIAEDDDHKVMVCHHTGSESNPAVIIVIDEHAVPAHEKHGDEVIASEDECEGAKENEGTPEASPSAEPTESEGTPEASPEASPGASPVAVDDEGDEDETMLTNGHWTHHAFGRLRAGS